mmetsp:Transcript_24819/g.57144  ORF Transcript_24819/g.57144 Transcript_24819/m.57144 type:complete len:543 (-) Transcript_24819:144-1772(-)|eukprot:CAMPEP_0113329576 /NCGR_PEP_ID=MMETSP0010_2-20120614/20990_1 /TAXON_ID=216773 ORGANISM="Corethron hystrix, Strain 308" /NCGR_SAMPLE_ID=MMETSP0010_2 /ASSEMBLY_ACC=CAM_ASM_000155 /LENGTH=542 /DNA_ID=CAMNT_0000191707 /DNA_START=79 /DNA_END=1707 /DNA_ORIENTATION=+ /assembly_acc=CAM_ASM_000155
MFQQGVSVYMFLAAVFDLNRIIVYATRFTDEIFALLISAIFIINALGNPFGDTGLYHYFKEDHKSHAYYASDPDYNHLSVALLSTFLCIGTVQVAASLKRTKFTSYYPTQGIRNTITDFSVVLAIALWTFVDKVVFPTIKTESLNVPAGFNPTYACCYDDCSLGNFPDDCPDLDKEAGFRPWLVDLTDLGGKPWLPFMAAGPALLAFILVFLDDGITWHLINHPSHKITHGAAYNWDTVVIGIMTLVNSLLGLPWLVAATVRSLNHVHALAEKTPDGKIQSVLETRLTHLGIHVLVLASIFALDLLKVIPMPVLYGVFLFMGIVSLGTNSFYNRFTMFFMQPEKYPMEPYTQYVKPSKMHLFTIIQLVLFVTLYVVKTIKAIAIAFPIVIALCIPVRVYVLTKIFTKEELIMIDSDEETIKRYLEKNEATPPEEEVSEKEKDIEKQDDDAAKENEDQVSGLPPLNMRRQPRKRSNFHKSLSAPQHSQANALFFGKVHDMPANEAEPLVQQELERRQRVRQESDPHMLLAEAERMISKDYRFG